MGEPINHMWHTADCAGLLQSFLVKLENYQINCQIWANIWETNQVQQQERTIDLLVDPTFKRKNSSGDLTWKLT